MIVDTGSSLPNSGMSPVVPPAMSKMQYVKQTVLIGAIDSDYVSTVCLIAQ